MKEQVVAVSDDVHFKQEGKRVQATTTVSLGYQGEWRELDLTDAHDQELYDAIRKFWDAGAKIDQPVRHKRPDRAPSPARRKFLRELRAWADSQGRSQIYRTTTGSHYYPVALRAEFCKETGATDPDYPDGFPVKK